MQVDVAATRPHYLHHSLPVYEALPAHLRGTVCEGREKPGSKGGPVLAASIGDYTQAARRPVILMEHGVGQVYQGHNPAYVGGTGRERVVLFLNPNEHATEANRRACPDVPSVTIGMPYLDQYHGLQVERAKVVAFAWHWPNNATQPRGSASSAWGHHHRAIPAQVAKLQADGWTVLGHAHPRVFERGMLHDRRWVDLRNWYGTMGVEVVEGFDDVLRRATVLVADQTSALWIAAAVGMRVVMLDCPAYQKAHALRLFPRFDPDCAPGPTVSDTDELADVIAGDGFDNRNALDLVVPFRDGLSAKRGAQAIIDHLI